MNMQSTDKHSATDTDEGLGLLDPNSFWVGFGFRRLRLQA